MRVRAAVSQCSLEQLALICAIATLILMAAIHTARYKIMLDFLAHNGAFQTFNGVRRILAGEFPGRDFNPYLGVGVTYFSSLLTLIFGKDFSASQFSSYLANLTSHWLSLFTLAYLCKLSWQRSLLLASLFTGFITSQLINYTFAPESRYAKLAEFFSFLSFKRDLPTDDRYYLINHAWAEIVLPSYSSLGLRALLPFVVSLIILAIVYFLKQRHISQPEKWLLLSLGIMSGLLPFWSNDYGTTSCICLIFIGFIYTFKQSTISKLRALSILFVSAPFSFLVIGSCLTAGHLNHWIQDNLIGAREDQFWYFFAQPIKVFSFNTLSPDIYPYGYAVVLFLFSTYIISRKRLEWQSLLLVYVGLTTLMAGAVASSGGMAYTRYFVPAIMVSGFIIPKSIAALFTTFWQSRPRLVGINRVLSILVIILLIIEVSAIWKTQPVKQVLLPTKSDNYFYVNELGGWLNGVYAPVVKKARQLRAEMQSVPVNQRILSTFASLIDGIVGAKTSSGSDYIIHVLGERSRQHYLNDFQVNKPRYITTLREDYLLAENLFRRLSWWFYREFLTTYEPVDATSYNLIWKRRDRPIDFEYPVAKCEIITRNNHSVDLIITNQPPTSNQEIATAGSSHFVDVELSYALTRNGWALPILGDRKLLNAIEIQTASVNRLTDHPASSPLDLYLYNGLQYGLPPHHQNWHIPLEHPLGQSSIIRLVGYPENDTRLDVSACQATLIAPTQRFELSQPHLLKNLSDHDWNNGILVPSPSNANFPSKSGFVIGNLESNFLLPPHSEVEFSHSGRRRVIAVRGEQVFVSGAPLDPIKDGYPNPVTFKLK
jgi:hypothetical protein